ncbi:hypothetical protein QBC36DRAFT_293131 [Triangularia setosa]|uniref:Uncharacterized protein n=1 Tax=Triangularia setosa TaxID=2587417 RepID=A0AAN7A623_9PEZI|nr:hypothetical protein QBC36DRAFT_293131 [Podospora setosa]
MAILALAAAATQTLSLDFSTLFDLSHELLPPPLKTKTKARDASWQSIPRHLAGGPSPV